MTDIVQFSTKFNTQVIKLGGNIDKLAGKLDGLSTSLNKLADSLSKGTDKSWLDKTIELADKVNKPRKNIEELGTAFSKLDTIFQQVSGSLSGNVNAAKNLAEEYPKLGSAVDVAKDSLWALKTGLSDGDFLTGISIATENIRSNMNGMQKATITAAAGFAEFAIVSDTIEGLVGGSENLTAGIIKIGAAVAIAAAAMYTALGPAGLVIAAIVGVVGAVKGINDALDAIRAEEIGNTIKNAMSNPGGTPLSEVTAQFADGIGKIGESFTIITDKASGFEQVNFSIRDIWLEIEKVEKSMETGVLSVGKGTEELTRLFEELSITTSNKFGEIEITLIAAFGENGVLNATFKRLGISTEGTIETIIDLNDKVAKRIEELTKLISETDKADPNYAKYREELASLSCQTEDITAAMRDYEFALSQIDYSELMLEDGSVNTDKLNEFLEEIKSAVDTANTDVENAINGIRVSLEEELNSAIRMGDTEAEEVLREKLEALPNALDLLKGDISLAATQLTDSIQIDFIGGINNVIDNAKAEWEGKTILEQILSGKSEGEYIRKAVEQQQTNINELSNALHLSLGGLQTEGAVWASDAANEIYGALFRTEKSLDILLGLNSTVILNENYREIIDGAVEGIEELAGERANEAVGGYSEGLSDCEGVAIAAGKTFVEGVMEAIAEAQDSHSPSKVTEGLGKDAVDGYANSFSDKNNVFSAENAVRKFVQNIIFKFSDIVRPMRQIGVDTMNGLYNGLSSMEGTLYSKADGIAKNIANTIKKALDINSPSRVMFELGEFTMEGFKGGMENLYQPTIGSIQGFGENLQHASKPDMNGIYEGHTIPSLNANNYSSAYSRVEQTNSNKEANLLLMEQNELLRQILEKDTKVNIGDREIYRATLRGKRATGALLIT